MSAPRDLADDSAATPSTGQADKYKALPADERPDRVCDACGGDGRFDIVEAAPGTLDGTVSYERRCLVCCGTGEVPDDSEPVTLDDIDALWPEGAPV